MYICIEFDKKGYNIMEFYSKRKYIDELGIPFRVHFFSQRLELMHHHDFDELVVIQSGSGIHRTDTMDTPVSAGDVFFIRKGENHMYINSRQLKIVNVMFDSSTLDINWEQLNNISGYKALFETEPKFRKKTGFRGKLTINSDLLNEVHIILQKIQREMNSRQSGWYQMSLTLLQELLIILARSYSSTEIKESRKMMRLSRMVQFIEKNYASELTRDQIIASGNVSNAVGTRIFRELLGKTPIGYLNSVRLNHAIERLKNGSESIADVARLCGFKDSNYFSSSFRKATGFSPRCFIRWQGEKNSGNFTSKAQEYPAEQD